MKLPLVAAALGAALVLPASAPAVTLYATDTKNRLLTFDSKRPAKVTKTTTMRGLPARVTVRGLDLRPKTGDLWLLGSDSRLYTLNLDGTVLPVSPVPFATRLAGTAFGFDFNPMVDRIRIVSDAEQNLRANPETGNLVQPDGPLKPGDPSITAAAYTTSVVSPTNAPTTTLYVIDAKAGTVHVQMPPNDGLLQPGKPLTIKVPNELHFDLVGAGNAGFITGKRTRTARTELFRINVNDGKVKSVGRVGRGKLSLTGLTGR